MIHSLEEFGLGIDFGSRVVKTLSLRRSAGRVDIQAAGLLEFDPGIVDEGVVTSPKPLAARLTKHLEEAGIPLHSAVFSIPSQLATLRWVSLPPLLGQDLREAARYKVKRHIPFSVEGAYIEASKPDVPDGAETGPSLVFAVPKAIVDSRAEVLEYAGIEPVSAELEASALLRVVERNLNQRSALWRDASLTIIDMGSNNAHMYVVQNQRLQFMRSIRFGSERIARAVSLELGIPQERAEELLGAELTELDENGILHVEVEGLPARVSVHSEVDKLHTEFVRLLRYFRSLHPERSYAGILDHVILCGGLGGLRGFAEYVQRTVGLRVERARPFAGMVGKFSKEAFTNIVNRQEAYTVSVGLAMSHLESRGLRQGKDDATREFVWARAS